MAVSLKSIRESVEKKYVAYEIELDNGEVVKLLNPLRLADDKLTKLSQFADEAGDLDLSSIAEKIEEVISTVAETPGGAKKLIAAAGRDRAVLVSILESYFEAQEAGEA